MDKRRYDDEDIFKERPIVFPIVKDFFLFFINGPKTEGGWVIWGLLLPITFPLLCFFQLTLGFVSAIASAYNGQVVVVDGGSGGGFFDEVSDRRREDIEFLMGTGKYAR